MKVFSRRALGAGLGLLLAATAVLPASAQDKDKVTVGILRLASSGPVFIALGQGYFADAGLDVELKFFDAAQPIAVAAASGDIDVGVTAITAGMLNLAGKGVIKIVAGQSREEPGYPLIAYLASKQAYENGLKTPKDLAGKTIGMTQVGSSFHYSMGLLAQKEGFDLSQTHLTPLQSMSNIASALKGGRIEAALLPATVARPLIDSGDAVLLGWVGDETPWQLGAVFVNQAMLDRKDALTRFLEAYAKGARDYHDDLLEGQADGVTPVNAETRPLLEMISQQTNQPVEKVAGGLAFIPADASFSVADIDSQIDWMRDEKFISGDFGAKDVIVGEFGFAK